MADTHTVLPKKLAQALMEASMQHFDAGGNVNSPQPVQTQGTGGTTQSGQNVSQGMNQAQGGFGNYLTTMYTHPWDVNQMSQGLQDTGQGVMNMLNPQNNFQAQAPNIAMQNQLPRIANNQAAQQATYNNQYNLAQTLLGQSQGQGPNPAQAQLAQNTANNVNTQGALMASQRGASANPALMARQAAMQGANIQQNSVGQAATLQAQQQLSAQQNLMQQQQNMQNAALQSESIGQGAMAAQNTAVTAGQLGAQGLNQRTAAENAQGTRGLTNTILGGASSLLGLSSGGMVPNYDLGGIMHYDAPPIPGIDNSASLDSSKDSFKTGQGFGKGIGKFLNASKGGKIKGKAEVEGNSEENDKVPALVSPGEIVLPRSVTMAPDMEKKAIEFLRHLKSGKKDYGSVMEARKQKLACGGKVY